MIPIFRRLKGLSNRRIEGANVELTDDSLEDNVDTDGPQPPKRLRFDETAEDIQSASCLNAASLPPPTQPPSVDNLEDQVSSFNILYTTIVIKINTPVPSQYLKIDKK